MIQGYKTDDSQPAILMDVFGTVLICQQPVLEPYEYIIREIGFTNPKAILKQDAKYVMTHGVDMQSYMVDTLRARYKKQKGEIISLRKCSDILDGAIELFEEHAQHHSVRPELSEFMRRASEIYGMHKIGLISNLAKPYIDTVESKIPQVEYKFYSCRKGMMKPDPRFFRQCCDDMEARPSRTIMIGNNIHNDVIAAQKAGLAMGIWAPEAHIHDPKMESIYPTIRNLNEVFPLLQKKGLLP